MLTDRIEELARLYEAARKPGIADHDYRDFMARVTLDFPVLLPVLRAAAAWHNAKLSWNETFEAGFDPPMTDVQPLTAEEIERRRWWANRCNLCGVHRSDHVKGGHEFLEDIQARYIATIDQQAETIRELKAALEEERRKFQAETLRTSALTQLLIRAEAVLCPEHEPGAWSRTCERCAVVADSRKLRATPINAAALTSTEAPSEPE